MFKDILGNGSEEDAAKKLFSGKHTLYSAQKSSSLPSAFSKMKVKTCIACGNRLEDQSQEFDVCRSCMQHPEKLYQKYNEIVRDAQLAEHRLCSIAHECQLCQDMEDAYQQCSNKDCEVYYARFKQIIEVARCR